MYIPQGFNLIAETPTCFFLEKLNQGPFCLPKLLNVTTTSISVETKHKFRLAQEKLTQLSKSTEISIDHLSYLSRVSKLYRVNKHTLHKLEDFLLKKREAWDLDTIVLLASCYERLSSSSLLRTRNKITVRYPQVSKEVWKGPYCRFLPSLLADVQVYLQSNISTNWLLTAAVVQYQLLAIHPFRDANGRITRALLAFLMPTADLFKLMCEKQVSFKSVTYYKLLSSYLVITSEKDLDGYLQEWLCFLEASLD